MTLHTHSSLPFKEAFWNWSLTSYAQDGVKERLLSLQDAHLMEVNTALWCIWSAQMGWTLEEEDIAHIVKEANDIAVQGVEPLRAVRRHFSVPRTPLTPDEQGKFRAKLLALELEAERLVQHTLAGQTIEIAGPPGDKRTESEDIIEIATKHFAVSQQALEKPIMFADERGSHAPMRLFGEIMTILVAR
ncbi:MAG: TIGR02444 family protein [Pseudomonadota bacterium]